MAGIGFELKKLFRRQSLTAKFSAVLYSVFSTIGHLLVVIGALIAVKFFLLNSDMPLNDQRLYSSIILYSFVFPLIFTSGICIIISRYLADMMWQDKTEDILASVYGALVVYCSLASIPAVILLWQAQCAHRAVHRRASSPAGSPNMTPPTQRGSRESAAMRRRRSWKRRVSPGSGARN